MASADFGEHNSSGFPWRRCVLGEDPRPTLLVGWGPQAARSLRFQAARPSDLLLRIFVNPAPLSLFPTTRRACTPGSGSV